MGQHLRAEGDEHATQREGADDTDEQHPLLQLLGTAKAASSSMKTNRLSTESDFSTR